MQRVRVPGGKLTSKQWRALAEAARRFTPQAPLHLTTRQDVELHDLTADQVPALQAELHNAGLTCIGACGDTLRNITVCPCATAGSAPDLYALGRLIHHLLAEREDIFSLPRKFKVSLSACHQSCGQPWINDLGLVAVRRDGAWGFRVIVAGSLGPRPAAGIELTDWLPAADVPAMVTAAIDVFASHGDRENRSKARLRHVRQRLGDDAFKTLLLSTLERVRSSRSWPKVEIPQPKDAPEEFLRLTFPCGLVSSEAAEELADVMEACDCVPVITNHHRVRVYSSDLVTLRNTVLRSASLRQAALPQPAFVACPGTRWCSRALTDTHKLADELRTNLAGKLPPDLAVCISGCPNGCAQSTAAEVGLVGRLATREGVKQEVYDLFLGGQIGRGPNLADPCGTKLTLDEVLAELSSSRQ